VTDVASNYQKAGTARITTIFFRTFSIRRYGAFSSVLKSRNSTQKYKKEVQ
jgi:hypothetical protein